MSPAVLWTAPACWIQQLKTSAIRIIWAKFLSFLPPTIGNQPFQKKISKSMQFFSAHWLFCVHPAYISLSLQQLPDWQSGKSAALLAICLLDQELISVEVVERKTLRGQGWPCGGEAQLGTFSLFLFCWSYRSKKPSRGVRSMGPRE